VIQKGDSVRYATCPDESGADVASLRDTDANQDSPDDLCDVVSVIESAITRTYAVTVILASTTESLGDHPASARLTEAIDALDAHIRDLRSVAFYMHPG
jgi:hypothetical protein